MENKDFKELNFVKIPTISVDFLQYANGFLKCNPINWLSSFSSHWDSLLKNLNVDFKLISIKTSLLDKDSIKNANWLASFDNAFLGCNLSHSDKEDFLEAMFVGSKSWFKNSEDDLATYFARRFFTSIKQTWNGPAFKNYVFYSSSNDILINWCAEIYLTFELNNKLLKLSLYLNQELLDILDGLWLRQKRASAKKLGDLNLLLQLADLSIPVDQLAELTTKDKFIPISKNFSCEARLISKDTIIFSGDLYRLEDVLLLKITSGSRQLEKKQNSQEINLSVILGQVKLTAENFAEISQIGAVFDTGLKFNSKVLLRVSNHKVISATLGTYNNVYGLRID